MLHAPIRPSYAANISLLTFVQSFTHLGAKQSVYDAFVLANGNSSQFGLFLNALIFVVLRVFRVVMPQLRVR